MQGDFNHWVPVFNHFDSFFEEHVKPRSDLQLKTAVTKPDPAFPVDSCLAVLRATAVLLEKCSNKQLYSSYEVSARKGGRPSHVDDAPCLTGVVYRVCTCIRTNRGTPYVPLTGCNHCSRGAALHRSPTTPRSRQLHLISAALHCAGKLALQGGRMQQWPDNGHVLVGCLVMHRCG